MLVRFEGGPLGGEKRQLPGDPGYRYRVPALRRRNAFYRFPSYRDAIPAMEPMYELHEYEYDGEVFTDYPGPRVRRYRWVDPYDGLREQIAALKSTVSRQEAVIAELEERPAYVNEAIEAAVRRAPCAEGGILVRRIDWIDLRSQRLAEFVMRHPRWAIPAVMVLARLGVFKSG